MDIEPPHHITYVLCFSCSDMPLKSTKDWRDGRLAVMMSGESGGYTCHLLITPDILLIQKEQAIQEEMA